MAFVTIRLRRGQAQEWKDYNPKLDFGEPGFELDTGKLKIGNGKNNWNDLPYITESGIDENGGVINAATHFDFPSVGKVNVVYKAETEKKIYQWNPEALHYEEISTGGNLDIDIINGGSANG